MNWQKIKKIDWREFSAKLWQGAFKYHEIIFIGIFIFVFIAGIGLSYKYLFEQKWNVAEREAYLQAKKTEANLDTEKLEIVLKRINNKKTADNQSWEIKDIFSE